MEGSTDSNWSEEKVETIAPIWKPHLKNIEQTSQNGYYVEMNRTADKESSHQSN